MKASILQILAVGLGGAIGSMLRFMIAMLWKTGSPISTLTVNVIGSLILGFFIASTTILADLKPAWRLMLTVGFCGGFTTFSTFSVQTMELFQSGRWFTAIGNILLNVILCILLAFLGYWIGKSTFSGV